MKKPISVSDDEILKYRTDLEKILAGRGYYLNPDDEFTNSLLKGVLINLKRYGYENCPCRLAANDKRKDLDIICPCYYRDDDVSDYGTCYCALYVSREKYRTKEPVHPIPERRIKPNAKERRVSMQEITIKHTIWRCNVCGYMCSRDTAPDVCPICGVAKERFEVMLTAE